MRPTTLRWSAEPTRWSILSVLMNTMMTCKFSMQCLFHSMFWYACAIMSLLTLLWYSWWWRGTSGTSTRRSSRSGQPRTTATGIIVYTWQLKHCKYVHSCLKQASQTYRNVHNNISFPFSLTCVLQMWKRCCHSQSGRAPTEGLHNLRSGAAGDKRSSVQKATARLLLVNVTS